jgi:hypothetical protein
LIAVSEVARVVTRTTVASERLLGV